MKTSGVARPAAILVYVVGLFGTMASIELFSPNTYDKSRASFGDVTMAQNVDIQEIWMEMRGRLRAFIATRVAADAAVRNLMAIPCAPPAPMMPERRPAREPT